MLFSKLFRLATATTVTDEDLYKVASKLPRSFVYRLGLIVIAVVVSVTTLSFVDLLTILQGKVSLTTSCFLILKTIFCVYTGIALLRPAVRFKPYPEILRIFEGIKHKSFIGWSSKHLPEEYRRHLFDLRKGWIEQDHSYWYIMFQTTRFLLAIAWAVFIIRLQKLVSLKHIL